MADKVASVKLTSTRYEKKPKGNLICKGCGSNDTVQMMADTAHKDEYTCRKCMLLMEKKGARYENGEQYREEKRSETSEVPAGYPDRGLTDRPG